jgi:hypothetical protein
MKQKQRHNSHEDKFTECKSLYQCVELDPLLKRGSKSIFKTFIGVSNSGYQIAKISYDTLAEKAGYSSRKTAILHVDALIDLGYIFKIYTGGKHSHDCNKYEVRIPRFYYDWIVPSKKKSKFTPQQQIEMAKKTLIKLGVVGENEVKHAIVQTSLKHEYEVLKNSKGLKKLVAKATINNTLKRFNEKNNVEFPTVL